VGKLIVNGAKPAGSGNWKGDLFDPDSGKTYKGTTTLVGDGLKPEGCVCAVMKSGDGKSECERSARLSRRS
jgi:uncharacterized protein (DUF2147 family)